MSDQQVCPACSAALQLVWVHGHGQCANCATAVVPCCMGAGQEADQHQGEANDVEIDDVLSAFATCSGGRDATTIDSLVLILSERHDCTRDAAMAAIQRAVALHRLSVNGRLAKRHA